MIYKKKIKPSKPVFIARRRSKKFGSGPFNLKNAFQSAYMMTKAVSTFKKSMKDTKNAFIKNSELSLYQNPLTPVKS